MVDGLPSFSRMCCVMFPKKSAIFYPTAVRICAIQSCVLLRQQALRMYLKEVFSRPHTKLFSSKLWVISLVRGYFLPQASVWCVAWYFLTLIFGFTLELENENIINVERLQDDMALNIDFEHWNKLEVFSS